MNAHTSQHVHPSGLRLALPEGALEVQQTATGFRLRPPGAGKRRAPTELQIELRPTPRPPGDFPESKQVDGREVRYRIDAGGGGSGGEEQTLVAWTAAGTGHILVEQHIQTEPPAPPDFSLAFTLIAAAH